MDFEFTDDQELLRDVGAAVPRRAGADRRTCATHLDAPSAARRRLARARRARRHRPARSPRPRRRRHGHGRPRARARARWAARCTRARSPRAPSARSSMLAALGRFRGAGHAGSPASPPATHDRRARARPDDRRPDPRSHRRGDGDASTGTKVHVLDARRGRPPARGHRRDRRRRRRRRDPRPARGDGHRRRRPSTARASSRRSPSRTPPARRSSGRSPTRVAATPSIGSASRSWSTASAPRNARSSSRSSTPRSASSSASRSARSRRSSTSAPTCCARVELGTRGRRTTRLGVRRRRRRPSGTAPRRWRRRSRPTALYRVGAQRDPGVRRHRLHLGARHPPVLQAPAHAPTRSAGVRAIISRSWRRSCSADHRSARPHRRASTDDRPARPAPGSGSGRRTSNAPTVTMIGGTASGHTAMRRRRSTNAPADRERRPAGSRTTCRAS